MSLEIEWFRFGFRWWERGRVGRRRKVVQRGTLETVSWVEGREGGRDSWVGGSPWFRPLEKEGDVSGMKDGGLRDPVPG